MATKKPSFQFYPGDWMKDPKLSMCQPSTRGVWMDLICAMHENEQSGEIVGTVNQLSRICRCLPNEMQSALEDLITTKTAEVIKKDVTGNANETQCNEIVTVRCRRMYEDAKQRKQTRERVNRFRKKDILEIGNENVTPPSSSSFSTSVEKEETIVSSKRKNGTRIPDDYYPSAEMLGWVKENAPNIDLEARILEFKNYWESKTGKDATKLDWNKTFQNRIIQILEWTAKNGAKNGNIQKYSETERQRREREAAERIEFSNAANELLKNEGIIQVGCP